MNNIKLRSIEPKIDFSRLAVLFTLEQDEPTTEPALMEDYGQHKERILRLMAAVDEKGELIGFNWLTRSRFNANQATIYVIVDPEQRRRGAGSLLFTDAEQAARDAEIDHLQVDIRDTCPECLDFARKRGFCERTHLIGMTLHLAGFDDRPYSEILSRLQAEGFTFTSMQELGNTEEAQRKLYELNSTADMETMGSDGSPSWLDFADFQQKVCRADWYFPAGQMVVIDNASGVWAAMSAVTRFAGTDYAYNLFTGVDKRYRGRKLGQAVKVEALRYARDVLQVATIRTHHNTRNEPILSIDKKLGYIQTPGLVTMQKDLP